MTEENKTTAVGNPFGEILENMLAPELYATSAPFFAIAPGVVTITFTSSRVDHSVEPPVRRQVVVGRVTLPTAGAADLATHLYTFLDQHGFKFASVAEKEHMQ